MKKVCSLVHVDVLPLLEPFVAEVAEFQESARVEGLGRRGVWRWNGGERRVPEDGGLADDLGVLPGVLLGFQKNTQTCHHPTLRPPPSPPSFSSRRGWGRFKGRGCVQCSAGAGLGSGVQYVLVGYGHSRCAFRSPDKAGTVWATLVNIICQLSCLSHVSRR